MKEEKKMKIKFDVQAVLRRGVFIVVDALSVVFAMLGAVLVCVNFGFGEDEFLVFWTRAVSTAVLDIIAVMIIFTVLRLYSSVWHYASVTEMGAVVCGCFLSTAAIFIIDVIMDIVFGNTHFVMLNYYFIFFFLLCSCVISVRFFYRAVRVVKHYLNMGTKSDANVINVMIIGAGAACSTTIKELKDRSQNSCI